MKQARLLCVSLLLAATLWPAAAQAIGRKLPQHVKDLVAGPRVCTGKGIYTYSASWTPITWDNKPWQRYIVQAHNCVAGPVSCTALRCTVVASGCRIGGPGTVDRREGRCRPIGRRCEGAGDTGFPLPVSLPCGQVPSAI